MRNLIKLERDLGICFNTNITEFLNPDYIYLPIKKNYYSLVKSGETVYKGQVILENNLNKVISPVSGKVVGKAKKNIDGTMMDVVVIENDYKEKEKGYRKLKSLKYDRDVLISKLYDYYFKYFASVLESKKINHLIISGIDDEPYVVNNSYVINKYSKEILEITDIMATTFNIKYPLIAMKNTDTRNIETFLSKIGTYPNITLKLVDDKYLLGKSFFLLEYLNISEHNSLVIDAKTMLDIYHAIKYNKYPLETFITISGPSVSRSQVVRTKIGTSLKEIVQNSIKIKGKDNSFVLNGLMAGYECDLEQTVVSKSTIALTVIPKDNVDEEKCNSCGLCYKICPVKVNPKKAMDSRKVSSSCIDCGLCTYICPCHINLRRFLRGEYE